MRNLSVITQGILQRALVNPHTPKCSQFVHGVAQEHRDHWGVRSKTGNIAERSSGQFRSKAPTVMVLYQVIGACSGFRHLFALGKTMQDVKHPVQYVSPQFKWNIKTPGANAVSDEQPAQVSEEPTST